MVHPADRRTTRSSPCTRRRSSSSATSGPSPRTSSPTARSSSSRGSTRPRSTSSRTTTGVTPTSVTLDARQRARSSSTARPAVQAFEAGEIDALDGAGLPPDEIARLKDTPEYELYPALGTYYYGFNIKNITDVHQRRALSLAINRQEIIDQIAQADQLRPPACRPRACPGFDQINAGLALAAGRRLTSTRRRSEMSPGREPEDGHQPVPQRRARPQGDRRRRPGAVEGARDQHRRSSSRSGPSSSSSSGLRRTTSVDVYRLGWIYDFPDAINVLELVDLRFGEQQHQLLRRGLRRPRRTGARRQPDDSRPVRHLRSSSRRCSSGRTARCRSCRSTGTRTRTSRTSR